MREWLINLIEGYGGLTLATILPIQIGIVMSILSETGRGTCKYTNKLGDEDIVWTLGNSLIIFGIYMGIFWVLTTLRLLAFIISHLDKIPMAIEMLLDIIK